MLSSCSIFPTLKYWFQVGLVAFPNSQNTLILSASLSLAINGLVCWRGHFEDCRRHYKRNYNYSAGVDMIADWVRSYPWFRSRLRCLITIAFIQVRLCTLHTLNCITLLITKPSIAPAAVAECATISIGITPTFVRFCYPGNFSILAIGFCMVRGNLNRG